MQGADLSRTELADQMRDLGNAVLFGTDSFWTGVDVPGDALAQVIVTRFPFDPPTHPITEAKTEWIRDHGGNPFNDLTLPDALIKFRQGIGRLIRTQSDRGLAARFSTPASSPRAMAASSCNACPSPSLLDSARKHAPTNFVLSPEANAA